MRKKQPKNRKKSSIAPKRKTQISDGVKVIEGELPPRGKTYLLIVALVALIIGTASPIVAQTQMAQRAFEIRQYQIELNKINAELSVKSSQLKEIRSTSSLKTKARSLGMGPGDIPIPISVERGIIGVNN